MFQESIKIAKTAPTDPGFGITPAPTPVLRNRGTPLIPTTPRTLLTPSSTYEPPRSFPIEVAVTPPPPSYSYRPSTPRIYVSPNSIDSSTAYNSRPTINPTPITAAEAAYDPSNSNSIEDSYSGSSTPYKRVDIYNPNSYRHADAWLRRRQAARIGDGYTPQFLPYDGVAINGNGFRYYLPKQYHEEVTGSGESKTGSFGYVDPFGIRRVIYYNAAPGEGFKIKKNNRFVGHDATPYDPRPID